MNYNYYWPTHLPERNCLYSLPFVVLKAGEGICTSKAEGNTESVPDSVASIFFVAIMPCNNVVQEMDLLWETSSPVQSVIIIMIRVFRQTRCWLLLCSVCGSGTI